MVFFHMGNTSFESNKIGFSADKINDLETDSKRTRGDYVELDGDDTV